MADDVRKQVLKWETDQSATRATQRAVQDLQSRIEKLRAEIRQQASAAAQLSSEWRRFAQGSRAATSNIDRLRKAAHQMQRTVDQMGEAVEDADRKMARARGPQAYEDRIRSARSQADIYGDIASRTTAVSGLASGLGFQGGGQRLMIAADIFDAVEAVKLAKAELPALASQLTRTGPLTKRLSESIDQMSNSMAQTAARGTMAVGSFTAMAAAAIAVTIAAKKFQSTMKETGEATRDWMEGQKQVADVLAEGTSAQAEARIEQEKANRVRNQIEKERLQAFLDQVDAQEGVTGALLDLNDALGLNFGGVKDVKERLKELNGELAVSENVVYELETALEAGRFAMNDMKAAAEEFAASRAAAFQTTQALETEARDVTADEATEKLAQQQRILAQSKAITRQAQQWQVEAETAQRKLDELAAFRERNYVELTQAERARFASLEQQEEALRKQVALAEKAPDVINKQKQVTDNAQASLEFWMEQLNSSNSIVWENTRAHQEASKITRNHTAYIQALNDAQTMSVEAVRDELEANEQRQKVIENTIARLAGLDTKAADDAIAKLEDELATLQDRAFYLTDVTIPTAQAIADEAEAQEELQTAVRGAFQTLARATEITNQFGLAAGRVSSAIDAATGAQRARRLKQAETIAAYQQAQAEAAEERQREMARNAADFARKRADDLAAHYRDLAEMDRDYHERQAAMVQDLAETASEANAERVEALQEHNQASRREAEDHQRRMIEIERDMRQGIEDAAARLDARAVVEELRRGKQALADEDEQYQLEAERRADDFQDRLDELEEQRKAKLEAGRQALRDLQAQHRRARQERISDFNRQRREEDQQRAIALQRQREDWAREDAERRRQAREKLQAIATNQSQEARLVATHYAQITAMTGDFMGDLQTSFATGFRTITGSGTSPQAAARRVSSFVGGSRTTDLRAVARAINASLPGFAGGGYPTPGTLARTGERGTETAMFLGNWHVTPHGQAPVVNVNAPVTVNGGSGSGGLDMVQIEQGLGGVVQRAIIGFFEGVAG